MILVSENTTADNGMHVQSSVQLRIEDIGVEDRPFFVQVRVNSEPLYSSFTRTEAEARLRRERMHAAYMETHSSPTASERIRALRAS